MLLARSIMAFVPLKTFALFCVLLEALKFGLELRFPSPCLLILAFIVALARALLYARTVLNTVLSALRRSPCCAQGALTCAAGLQAPLLTLLPA